MNLQVATPTQQELQKLHDMLAAQPLKASTFYFSLTDSLDYLILSLGKGVPSRLEIDSEVCDAYSLGSELKIPVLEGKSLPIKRVDDKIIRLVSETDVYAEVNTNGGPGWALLW